MVGRGINQEPTTQRYALGRKVIPPVQTSIQFWCVCLTSAPDPCSEARPPDLLIENVAGVICIQNPVSVGYPPGEDAKNLVQPAVCVRLSQHQHSTKPHFAACHKVCQVGHAMGILHLPHRVIWYQYQLTRHRLTSFPADLTDLLQSFGHHLDHCRGVMTGALIKDTELQTKS